MSIVASTFPVLAFVAVPFVSFSTEPPPDGPVPHNTPSRILPTVPLSPVEDPGEPTVDEDWFELCVTIGSCSDLGSPCPPQQPFEGASAVWCGAPTLRGACEGWALWIDCQQINRDDGCGLELTGVCRYQPNGTLIDIHPGSIRSTGAFCPGTTCSWN